MNIANRLFKTSVIYFIGQVFTKLISFILLPLYTNYVKVSDYGYYDLSISLLSVVVPVVFMEIWTATLRFSLERENDQGKRIVVNNSLIIASFFFLIYFTLYTLTSIALNFSQSIWIFLYSITWVLQLIYLSVTRTYGKNTLYASSGVISVAVNTFISIIAVFMLNGSISALYIGMIASFIFQVIIIEIKLPVLRNFKLDDFDKTLCIELIKFSLPLSFNSVINWLLEGCNKLIIVKMLGSVANGIYAIGNRLSTILNLLVSVFLLSWQESIFRLTDRNEKKIIYNLGINNFLKAIGGCLVILLPLISVVFPYLIRQDYRVVYGLIPLLLLSIFANALCSVISPLFAAEKQTKYSFYSKIIMSMTNLIVILSSIDFIGLYASPIALITANVIGIIVQLKMANKFIEITLKINNIFFFIIMFIIATCFYYYRNNLLNIIWFFFSLIIYYHYMKDFIHGILNLVLNQFSKRKEIK